MISYTNSSDFTIGPNPFDISSIINSHIDGKFTRFSLIDSRGQKVWEYHRPYIYKGDRINISGEGLADGLYILKIDTERGSYLYKLVKK